MLGIIELLRFKSRVLYVDIDVHHGDGVEEAFYTTDRVMTCSFHKYGEYFPGTGELRDIGVGQGKNYAVNFPLRDGINDASYKSIFEPVVTAVMQYFRPEAVVLQCGGDSLSGDRLGCFNLSMKGHANCVKFVKSFGLPTLVVGGGGYTMRNVARTWAYETGVLVGEDMGPVLPFNEYYEYYGPDYELDVRSSNMENANSVEYLEKIKIQVIENLKKTAFAPSVQMQDVPREPLGGMTEEEEAELDDLDEDENKDTRHTQRRWDKAITRNDELDESDDEESGHANGVRPQNGVPKRKNIMDYQNPNTVDSEVQSGVQTPDALPEVDTAAAAAVASQTNAEVSAEVLEIKASNPAVAELAETGPSNAASQADSPRQVDEQGDINMDEPLVEPIKPEQPVPEAEQPVIAAATNLPITPTPVIAVETVVATESAPEPPIDADEKTIASEERDAKDVADEIATEIAEKMDES